jgi:hypothetical protein
MIDNLNLKLASHKSKLKHKNALQTVIKEYSGITINAVKLRKINAMQIAKRKTNTANPHSKRKKSTKGDKFIGGQRR